MHINFQLKILNEKDHTRYVGADGRIILKLILKEIVCNDVD